MMSNIVLKRLLTVVRCTHVPAPYMHAAMSVAVSIGIFRHVKHMHTVSHLHQWRQLYRFLGLRIQAHTCMQSVVRMGLYQLGCECLGHPFQ